MILNQKQMDYWDNLNSEILDIKTKIGDIKVNKRKISILMGTFVLGAITSKILANSNHHYYILLACWILEIMFHGHLYLKQKMLEDELKNKNLTLQINKTIFETEMTKII